MADLRSYLFAEVERSLQTLLDNHVVSIPAHAAVVSVLRHERDGSPVSEPLSGFPAEPLGGADPALKAYLLKETERTLQGLHDNRFLTPEGHAKITSLLTQIREQKGIPQQPPAGYIPPVAAYSPNTQPQVFQGYTYPQGAYAQGYPQPAYNAYPQAYNQQGQYATSPGQCGQQALQGQYGTPYDQTPFDQQSQYGQPYPYSQQYPQYTQQQPYVHNPGMVGTPNVTPLPTPSQDVYKPQSAAQPQPQPAPVAAHASGSKPPSAWGMFANRMGNNIANGMSSGFGWTMGGNVANGIFHKF